MSDVYEKRSYKTQYNTHAIKQQKEILCVSLFCFSTPIKGETGRVEPIFSGFMARK